jgi:hypothetical protein
LEGLGKKKFDFRTRADKLAFLYGWLSLMLPASHWPHPDSAQAFQVLKMKESQPGYETCPCCVFKDGLRK